MSVTERLDRFQQKHTWAGFPLAVIYKFTDDQGGYLTATLAYYSFLSLFPLLLLLTTLLGFLLSGDVSAQQRVLTSTLSQFPIIGDQIRTNVTSLRGSAVALTVGVAGSLYGGLGVAQAGQNAMNNIWGVSRNRRPNPLRARLNSLTAVLALGIGAVATTVLSGLFTGSGSGSLHLGIIGRFVALGVSLVGNMVIFVAAFRMLTADHVHRRDLVPGAVAAAVAWQGLQWLGTYYVRHSLTHATQTYGLFGVVLGLVAFLHLAGLLTLLCAEVNVVRARRLWPRSLMTPFTDDVHLTEADERSYESLATTQQTKGFEDIDVSFDNPKSPRADP
jgi:YihY family inner membrane protein